MGDDWTDVVRREYHREGLSPRKCTELYALLRTDFPHAFSVDVRRYIAWFQKQGLSGPAFEPLERHCVENAGGPWRYASRTPESQIVFMFRNRSDAEGFAAAFPGEMSHVRPAMGPDRRAHGCGRISVSLGWHQIDLFGGGKNPRTERVVAHAEELCAASASRGMWDVSGHGASRVEGGYSLGTEYHHLKAWFTHHEDADAFSAVLHASAEWAAPDDRSVAVGELPWGRRDTAEAMLGEARAWLVENVGWFNWGLVTAPPEGSGACPAWLVLPDPASARAFEAWRSGPSPA